MIYHNALPPKKSCVPVKSLKNLHILYFYYHSGNSRQTWQNVKLNEQAPTRKVTGLFDYLVLWGHVRNLKSLSSLPPCVMQPKLSGQQLVMTQWVSDVLWTSNGRLYEDRTSYKHSLNVQRTSDCHWRGDYTHKAILPILTNMWSRKVIGKIKIIISPLSECLWSPTLSGWEYTAHSSDTQIHTTLIKVVL